MKYPSWMHKNCGFCLKIEAGKVVGLFFLQNHDFFIPLPHAAMYNKKHHRRKQADHLAASSHPIIKLSGNPLPD